MIVFRSAAEARVQWHQEIPNLRTANWRISSPVDTQYQCIAWAACRTNRVWWPWDHPSFYWPAGFPKLPVNSPVPIDHFSNMFKRRFGYRECNSPTFEFGYQKVAIFSNGLGVTHMARQHFFGRGWLSKLGTGEDILHEEVGDVAGDINPMAREYGVVAQILKRSWWTALIKLCLFHSCWSALRFRVYRTVIRWDLT